MGKTGERCGVRMRGLAWGLGDIPGRPPAESGECRGRPTTAGEGVAAGGGNLKEVGGGGWRATLGRMPEMPMNLVP